MIFMNKYHLVFLDYDPVKDHFDILTETKYPRVVKKQKTFDVSSFAPSLLFG